MVGGLNVAISAKSRRTPRNVTGNGLLRSGGVEREKIPLEQTISGEHQFHAGSFDLETALWNRSPGIRKFEEPLPAGLPRFRNHLWDQRSERSCRSHGRTRHQGISTRSYPFGVLPKSSWTQFQSQQSHSDASGRTAPVSG